MSRTRNNIIISFRRGPVIDLNTLPLLDFNDAQHHSGIQGGMPMIDLNLPAPGHGNQRGGPLNLTKPDPADPNYPPPPPEDEDEDEEEDKEDDGDKDEDDDDTTDNLQE